MVGEELHVSTIHLDAAFLAQPHILLTSLRREAPVLADDDLLAAGELVLGAAQGLDSSRTVCRSTSAVSPTTRVAINRGRGNL
jgi:hypothetical protein